MMVKSLMAHFSKNICLYSFGLDCLGLACWQMFFSVISSYCAAFILPSTQTVPGPAAERHPHRLTPPAAYFTVGMVCF